jgi:hypothetical protein
VPSGKMFHYGIREKGRTAKNMMNTKTTMRMVGVLVGMSVATSAVMAQQAETGKLRPGFQGPVKVFILARQLGNE